jgi:hypothetical protein
MADNTTTYTAVIETEVKGTDEVEQLGDEAEKADGKFKSLKSQIRETTIKLQELADKGQEGTKEFKKLSDQLDELGDQQKKVAFQSGQIEDKLAALPGPIGAIGKGFQSAKSAVDTFGVRLAIATGGITLIIGAIIAMKDALGKSEQGQATLNKVTDAFSKLLAPLLTMVSAVAIPTFEFFANVINKVADAAEWVAVKLGFTKKSIEGFNESAAAANKKFFEQAEKDMEEAKRVADVYKAIDEKKKSEALARQKAYQEKSDKLKEEQKKKDAEKQKVDDAANKVLVDAYIATLSQRDQEIYNAGLKQNERMRSLRIDDDPSSVLEQYRIEVADINKKYDDEAAKKVEDFKKKKSDDDKKAEDDKKAKIEKDREDDLLGLQNKLDFENNTFQQKKDLITAQEQVLLSNQELTENQRTQIQQQAAQQRKAIDEAERDAKAEILLAQIDLVGQFGSFMQQIAGKNKKLAIAGIVVQQAAAIGSIIANTAIANAKAAAAFPLTLGQPWVTINTISAALGVASTIASAAKSISQINSSDNATSVSGAGAGLQTNAMTPPTAPSVAGAAAPIIQGTQSATPGAQIASTLAQTSGKPVKAYVVSGDISSQQALDRRTSNSATFGGY